MVSRTIELLYYVLVVIFMFTITAKKPTKKQNQPYYKKLVLMIYNQQANRACKKNCKNIRPGFTTRHITENKHKHSWHFTSNPLV